MVTLLPGGFLQLLPIIQRIASMHLGHIQEVARGDLASGTGAPSEQEAMACLLRIFAGRHNEVDWKVVNNHLTARALGWWEGWQDLPKRKDFADLVMRADRREKGIGPEDNRRPPTHGEGRRLAEPLLAGIPGKGKISLDAEGEQEAVVQVLAALLSPPMGEPSPEKLQEYHHLAGYKRVYYDALDRRYNQLDNPVNAIPSLPLRWKSSIYGRRLWRHYPKTKVAPHSPLNPAILLRNLQIQFVIGFLDRVGIRPLGKSVSGCRIVADVLGMSEYSVKRIWEKRFTVEMRKHSEAIAELTGLLDTTTA